MALGGDIADPTLAGEYSRLFNYIAVWQRFK